MAPPEARAGGRRTADTVMRTARATIIVVLMLLGSLVAEPGHAAGPVAAPALAANDLGTVRAEGVTLTDSLGSFGQANAYTFRVADGRSSVHLYVGDLWYDVDVLLLRASALPDDSTQWRTMACGGDCLASAPASTRRRVQLLQPKGLIEAVEPGTYAVVVRPRDEAGFNAWHHYTLRVVVTPPACAVTDDSGSGYRLALVMAPMSPGRSDLVTMTAYVLPPFGDLFDYAWSVDGRVLPANGATAQAPALELSRGRAGPHDVRVIARGARPYPDPDQAEIPPTLSAGCSVTTG